MRVQLIGRLMILGAFSCCCQAFGQEKINVTWGIGFPELLNFGVRYEMGQTQIGVNYGSIPHTGAEEWFSISSDVYYHFGGMTRLSERRPWYARTGLNYVRDETTSSIENDLFLNVRIGRDFNISKKVGVEIDAGPGFLPFHKRTIIKTSNPWDLNFNFPVSGLRFFVGFKKPPVPPVACTDNVSCFYSASRFVLQYIQGG
jgi:hypothetical protein